MSTVKHAKLAKYIQQHKMNWDLDFKVVMPGKAGKQRAIRGIPAVRPVGCC
jgi:hypothetical protein